MKKNKRKPKCVSANIEANIEKYLDFMERMPGMLVEYLTHNSQSNRLKAIIGMHLSSGKGISGLVRQDGQIVHGYSVSGNVVGSEVWVMPIRLENEHLLAVQQVENNKMYIQDTPLCIRKIAG